LTKKTKISEDRYKEKGKNNTKEEERKDKKIKNQGLSYENEKVSNELKDPGSGKTSNLEEKKDRKVK
jgi:hypothetical protein